jgi:hypothetical protein
MDMTGKLFQLPPAGRSAGILPAVALRTAGGSPAALAKSRLEAGGPFVPHVLVSNDRDHPRMTEVSPLAVENWLR